MKTTTTTTIKSPEGYSYEVIASKNSNGDHVIRIAGGTLVLDNDGVGKLRRLLFHAQDA